VPGSPYPQHQIAEIVDRAIAEGDPERALQWARGLKRVTLDRALALTVALGHQGDGRYLAAAHRFLVRFILEVRPSLLNLKKVVDALDVVGRVRQMPELQQGVETAWRISVVSCATVAATRPDESHRGDLGDAPGRAHGLRPRLSRLRLDG
jgi:hypothetical protein